VHPFCRQALVTLALLAASCPTWTDDRAEATEASEGSGEEFRARAHEKALQIAIPLGEAALLLEDPVSGAQLGLGELLPEPIGPGRLAKLRDAHAKAWREVDQIDPRALETDSVIALSVLRMGLVRIARRLERQRPARYDLGWAVAAADRFVAEAEHVLTHGEGGCADGLEALADTFTAAGRELGASSVPSLKAALEDLQSIRARLLRFPELRSSLDEAHTKALDAAVDALDALVELTEARIASLGKADEHPWGEPVLPARAEPTLVRLPPRIGPAELRTRLSVEEAVGVPAEKLFDRAAVSLTTLQALADRAGASEPLPRKRATLVDRPRCDALASRVNAWAEQAPGLTVSVRCDAVVKALAGTALDDADLLIRVVGSEVVEPLRRERRKQADRPLSLLAGDIAPASHLRAATLGVLAAMGETNALRRAVMHARDDLCLAAAAIWYHAELGDDAGMKQKLAPHCDSRPVDAWTALAAARPRRALRGLGLASLDAKGRAKNLDALWWGPLGLPDLLADATHKPSQSEGLSVKIEELKPGTQDE